ncbi:UDP-N-acetylgalactosaminyltransferase [Desulfocucumis palustris]|uniref:UDP-N-acetylgalactosaminyltransferase n=1 Tax=Desulfocucumis palustris TaxID=1898651 RepID=A0A2L2XHX2_9FIRM|nr:sugar transferase [Desulfocucumis palustris]GBF33836.1 UDP-N-acetylgalactosaminyltransferase [Desulfocucumis palustris]
MVSQNEENKSIQKAIKRLFDIIVAFLAILVFLPIGVIITILIKVTSSGPVFFVQERPGRHRKLFKVFKFRTMKKGSDKMVKGQEVMKDDERITSIGRFLRRSKIDEIPQMLNILKGEMSLVGPRPERVASLADYTEEIAKRLNVRPGLTGLAQVSGNIYIPLEERYKFDIYYVEHFSLWLDIRIILRTIDVVLHGEGKFVDKCLVDMQGKIPVFTTEKETINL